MNNNEEDKKFKSSHELKDWLVHAKGVHEVDAVKAASILYDKDFNVPSKLIGITVDMLKNQGLSDPVAMTLSNKLEKRPHQQGKEYHASIINLYCWPGAKMSWGHHKHIYCFLGKTIVCFTSTCICVTNRDSLLFRETFV